MEKPKLFIKDGMLIYTHSKTKLLDISLDDCLECGTSLGTLRVRVDENSNPTDFYCPICGSKFKSYNIDEVDTEDFSRAIPLENICLITAYLTEDHNMEDFRFYDSSGNRDYDLEFEGGDKLGMKISEFEKLIELCEFEKIFCSTFIRKSVLDKFMLEFKKYNSGTTCLALTTSEKSAKEDYIFNVTGELSNDGIKEVLKRFLKRGIYIHCKKSSPYSLYVMWQEYFEKFKEEHPGVYLQFVVNNPELVED